MPMQSMHRDNWKGKSRDIEAERAKERAASPVGVAHITVSRKKLLQKRDELYSKVRDKLMAAIRANPDLGEPVEQPMEDGGPLACTLTVTFGRYKACVVIYNILHFGESGVTTFRGIEMYEECSCEGREMMLIGYARASKASHKEWPSESSEIFNPERFRFLLDTMAPLSPSEHLSYED